MVEWLVPEKPPLCFNLGQSFHAMLRGVLMTEEKRRPSWMPPGLGRGTETLDTSSLVWIGENLDRDPYEIIEKRGNGLFPLATIVRAIILAHPSAKGTVESRIRRALEALTGRHLRRGPPPNDLDDQLISAIARQYFEKFVKSRRDDLSAPQITTLVHQFVEALDPEHPALKTEKTSLKKRLERKFRKDKDWYLSRVTTQTMWKHIHYEKNLTKVVELLDWLGIPVELPRKN
jgi:hypothetical protein